MLIFTFPTRIVFGNNTIEALPHELSRFEFSKILIVTDGNLRQLGIVDKIEFQLKSLKIDYLIFDGVDENPTDRNLDDGSKIFELEKCDLLIGVGGGSVLDVSKLIKLKNTHKLPIEEYDFSKSGHRKILPEMPPFIAVPTTAGSGSEVASSAVITLSSDRRKIIIFSQYLMAQSVIADVGLTLELPKDLTACTGFDALTHHIEAYLSTAFHPICDGIATEGIKLVRENLLNAVKNGFDLEAREKMLMASLMGGIVLRKGLGATHSLAHPLSSVAGLRHGVANAVMLPHVLDFNREFSTDRLVRIAGIFGIEINRLTPQRSIDILIERLNLLREELGISGQLNDFGVSEELFETLATQASIDICHRTNPRTCSFSEMLELYRKAKASDGKSSK